MTLTIVKTTPTSHSSAVTPLPFSLDDLAPWDRHHVIFAREEAATRLWHAFGIYATRDKLFTLDEHAHEPDPNTPADRAAVTLLRRMATEPQMGMRQRLFPTVGMIEELARLAGIAPNFAGVLQLVRTAVLAALHTKTPIRIPPLLLLGPPGVGKTFVSSGIASALGTAVTRVDYAGGTGLNPLGGTNRIWRGADVGAVARALIGGKTSSPIFLLDEIDKPCLTNDGDPRAVLHQLLEPDQAKQFRDECLEVRTSADEAIWIATANTVGSMPRSLLDRFHIFDIAPPSADQMKVVVRTLIEAISRERFHGWFTGEISDDVVDRVRSTHPRRARRIIELACQAAAAANRTSVTAWDVISAEKILGGSSQ